MIAISKHKKIYAKLTACMLFLRMTFCQIFNSVYKVRSCHSHCYTYQHQAISISCFLVQISNSNGWILHTFSYVNRHT